MSTTATAIPASPAARHTPGPWRFTCNASRIELKTDAMHSYAFSLSDEANARLIAAAPELLAALEEVWSFWAGGDCPPELEEKIKLAIASAKGGAA